MAKTKTKSFGTGHYHELSTLDLIKEFIISKLPTKKQPFQVNQSGPPEAPKGENLNHIAIVLDGVVEETIHCQNRLAALLLSEPIFVEYDPNDHEVSVGSTTYKDGKFVNDELMTDSEIKETIDKLGLSNED